MPKKLILDIDEDTWKEVLKYKIDNNLKNNNDKISYQEYLEFSKKWMHNCYGWLKSAVATNVVPLPRNGSSTTSST